MVPEAPALLSMMMVHLFFSVSLLPTRRERLSVPPPGVKGMIRRIGRSGYVWACATSVASTAAPSRMAVEATAGIASSMRVMKCLLG
jgi:hypothetical protein